MAKRILIHNSLPANFDITGVTHSAFAHLNHHELNIYKDKKNKAVSAITDRCL